MTAKVIPLYDEQKDSERLSDEAVALACASADPAAVSELFRRYHEAVTRYLSRLVRDPVDVEDLLQATFLEIARGRANYCARSKVQTWLLGIATNVTRIYWRSAKQRKRLEHALTLVHSNYYIENAHTVLESQATLERARCLLEHLPDGQREAFVLCEIEGLTAREAADTLQISEAAVWKRVSIARQTIVRLVARRGNHGDL
jgi:RNA polymerase sigma-70 factor (ECF subfamily)